MEKTDFDFLRRFSPAPFSATRYFFGGGGRQAQPPAAPAAPTQIKAAEIVSEQRKAVADRKRRGFASTQYTGPGGVQTAAPAVKALFGA